MSQFVELSAIRLDGGTQPRSTIDLDLVAAYATDMGRGDPFPPIVTFFDGTDYWLADGFHRYRAAEQIGRSGLPSEVRQGTQRDAILYSVGANAEHGWRRSNEDKRRSVQRLLVDPEWSIWSDREIARHCRVDHKTVAGLRPAPPAAGTGEIPSMPRTFVHPRTGQPSVMETARIGAKPEPEHSVFDQTPAGSRPAPAPVAAIEASAEFHANRAIHHQVQAVLTAIDELPSDPADAARRYPPMLRAHCSAAQAQAVADWFADFAREWAAENGAQHVAA